MAGRVKQADAWLDANTTGAPAALLVRVQESFVRTASGALGERLARAGGLALSEAVHRGTGREAALDLLAADALITLALLESAERDPAGFGIAARSLRLHAAEAA